MTDEVFDKILGEDLRGRLHIITRHVAHFWEEGPHHHFTFHGLKHSRQVQKKLVELIQEWDKNNPLSEDELFILFAAALLYDVGMQCTDLRPELDFDWQHKQLTHAQLQQIREKKHLLTYRMIFQSVNHTQRGYHLQFGLLGTDDYTRRIAEVCQGCSDRPLEPTNRDTMRNGPIRIPLLIGLLRLADQLYIDSERVDIELLEHTALPPAQKLRWWLYHYTQTLPIDKGQIPFRYVLPSSEYKKFLGHIRTLIEQPFHYITNPVIQDLWGNLKLIPHKNALVEDASPHTFLREMNSDLMQELSNVQMNKEYEDDVPQKQIHEYRCLLVLDYENFLVQLGLEGYYPTLDDLTILLPDLLIAAREQYPGHLIDGIAAGHWQRPNLRSTATIFQDMYTLITLKEQEQGVTQLSRELQRLVLPHQVLLVAPPRSLAGIARQLQEKGQAIGAWITDNRDARIFSALIHHTQPLHKILNLPTRRLFSQEELKALTESCILCLKDKLSGENSEISFEAINTLFTQIELLKGKLEWFRLYLLQQEIIIVDQRVDQYVFKLNKDHVLVDTTLKKRSALISSFPSMSQLHDGKIRQEALLHILQNHDVFQDDRDHILQFLKVLRQRDIIFVDAHMSEDKDNIILWQLNSAHPAVIALHADRYLPFFLLGLDHALVRHSYPSLHERTLDTELKKYMDGGMMIQAAYQLALNRGWVKKREHQYQNSKSQMVVEPAYELREVQEVVLNCSLLLKILYSKTRDEALQYNALWHIMSHIPSFTLKRDDFNHWLEILQRNNMVCIEKDAENINREVISLCRDTLLVQHLLGRLNMCWVVLAMRTLRAKSVETAQPMSVVVQRVASFVARDDGQTLAMWSIEQAKRVKLLQSVPAPQQNNAQPVLFLNQHSIVRRLDAREKEASQALVTLVRSSSRPHQNDGWVPRPVIIQRMGNNPVFGSTYEEFNYWINNAIHKKPGMLKEKTDPTRSSQTLLQVII